MAALATEKKPDQINQKQYAEKAGISQPAVSYRLKKNMDLPGVSLVENFGRFYLLTLEPKINWTKIKKDFKN